MLGLLSHTSGSVRRAKNLKIGYMPQKLHIDRTLPITVNRFLRLAYYHDSSAIEQALDKVDGQHLIQRSLNVLSGGELQRVLLARAILRKPDLLVLDEPVQGVDIKGQKKLYQLIIKLKDLWNCSVILVSHDLHLVLADSDQVICLNRHICCAGQPESVVKDPAYTQLFGHEALAHLAVYEHEHDHEHDNPSGQEHTNTNG